MVSRVTRSLKSFISLLLAGLVLPIAFAFQNCSKSPLEQFTNLSLMEMPALNLKSHACGEPRFTDGQASKFVFIMDLSASNFGNWSPQTVGGQKLYYWDPSLATDPEGARFDAILNFLNSCGNQTGAQFAFIGFSKAAGILANGRFSCETIQFDLKTMVTNQINEFRNRQSVDQNWYEQWLYPYYLTESQPDSLIYSVTSYTSASQCLEKLIIDDLTSNTTNQADRYNIFFISDGKPEDKAGTGCNLSTMTPIEKTSCYMENSLSSVTMIKTAALSKGKELRIQGIYYGDDSTPEVLNAISSEGGSPQVAEVGDFSDEQSAICDLVVNQSAIDYQPDIYMTINLTMHLGPSGMLVDSDHDGLDDVRELSLSYLGYDPQNPRSSGVDGILDGICERLGGIDSCQQMRNQISCSPNTFDKLGLSDCDLKILGLNALPYTTDDVGVDFDRDGFPDFVEILKGTDPRRTDMTQDPDNDGLINRAEILRGSDLFFADQGISSLLLNKYSMRFNLQTSLTCPNGDWELSTDKLQTAKTMAATEYPEALSHLQHNRNEQLVLIIYRLVPVNSLEPEIEYYGRVIRISASGYVGAEILEALPNELHPEDFMFLGKVRP